MPPLQLTLNDYIGYLKMSHKKKLLVEGPADGWVFDQIIDLFDRARNKIEVDNAEMLIGGFGIGIGNRQKVEIVCSTIDSFPDKDKLVGFVDREFREFDCESELNDGLNSHKVKGRLIWSRGHSLENYYFEFETCHDPISAHSGTQYYHTALKHLENQFENIIRFACVASLVGKEIGIHEIFLDRATWEIFTFSDNKISLNLSRIESNLKARNHRPELIKQVISRYDYWEKVVFGTDYDTTRWVCHGHIGIKLIELAFGRIVYEISRANGNPNPDREAANSIQVRDEVGRRVYGKKWIDRSLTLKDKKCIFPFEVLTMLDLSTDSSH